ncbi:MAG: bifunctional adenosylcobinamide kinase/adenosylcobinamide-phosphate guanylyltransferase [Pyramidobacter sp.]|nr:bifunctional adenosylcobinamide kinase/adenosylcobinamide-phosphate guanylyltransferase [Pyramidobacter sp.]
MLILVTGCNGSGKSRCAEKIAARFCGKKFYAATMIPYGPEGEARKQKHICQREGLGFVTVECPFSLEDVPAEESDLVLLEDVSNLLANVMFDMEHHSSPAAAESQITALETRCHALIAVTIGGLTGDGCDEATKNYVNELNALNARLASRADTVIELREGTPFVVKGECLWSI